MEKTSAWSEGAMFYFPYTLVITHKTSAFGVHEGDMLMVTAFFNRREHLGGRHEHQKMPDSDDHSRNLVH